MMKMIQHDKNVQQAFRYVSETYRCTYDEILSECRERRLSDARKHLCYLLTSIGISQSKIGKLINRHRTAVLYLVKKYEDEQYIKRKINNY